MSSSDNERSLYKIVNMIGAASVIVLLLHFYFYCYDAFMEWGLVSVFSDRVFRSLSGTGLFRSFHTSKLISLGLLVITLAASKGRKMSKLRYGWPMALLGTGLILYFGSVLLFYTGFGPAPIAVSYMGMAMAGFFLVITGGSLLSRILKTRLYTDVFNTENETFPQETRRIDTGHNISLPYCFKYKGKTHDGWINLNTVRGLLLSASSGSGKTWYIIQHVIRQHISKGQAMFIYDFKYDDLTLLAYNCFLRYKSCYPVAPGFYALNFDDLSRTHRCNALAPESMTDIADAAESARSILLGLNPDWIPRQGDFWVESAIAFLTALIWYLRRYQGGKYCTLAHVIELSQVEYHKLFSVLRVEPEIQGYLAPFLSAYLDGIKETIGNQMVSLKIAMARLSSPAIYYVVSGNDLTLDINNPAAPKIVCMGSNPRRSGIYGSVISLYISTLNRLVNKTGGIPCSEVYEEASTIYNHQLPETLATGRSNGISVTICIQGFSQLKAIYGKDRAEVLFELPANKIFGQQTGESARWASGWIGRVKQEKESIQTNRSDTSISRSVQLDAAVPVSTIAKLSAGEFVGLVADDPDNPIGLKAFHGHIVQDNAELAKERMAFKALPVIRPVTREEVLANFTRIRGEVEAFVDAEISRMLKTDSLAGLVIAKRGG
jgi:hypothetical protein